MRAKAVIAYDGSKFYGFQSQKSTERTVVGALRKALGTLGINSEVVGAGRTDRGVHATAQVVHFDLPGYWSDLSRLRHYLNATLHPAIHIRRLHFVPEVFHARYCAKRRGYRYILSTKEFSPFMAHYVTYTHFDPKKITRAVHILQGYHDFRFFLKRGSDTKSTIRTIYRATSYRHKDFFVLYFEADGFLRAQVRMMVDFLLAIGRGEASEAELLEQLRGITRHRTTLAPPQGLYLCRVVY
jgi:tRNA pseudouridine38-40 synthase